jgi:sugar O-acyltransferase (sialic acid O-acetyltransferase NeuD family)
MASGDLSSTKSLEPQRVVVVGAGEQADIAHEYLTHDSPHEVVGFAVERAFLDRDTHRGLPVVPLDELGARFDPGSYRTLVAISSTQLNRVRRRLFGLVKDAGFTCITYVSSRAFVWRNVEIGENSFVFEHNVLQHQVRVGDNVVLWSGNHVGHQSVIEDDCFISSHVVIPGYCRIGRGSFLGVNSCLADGLTLGPDCVVGAGAVLVRDAEARTVYVGNPARALDKDSFETFGVEEE